MKKVKLCATVLQANDPYCLFCHCRLCVCNNYCSRRKYFALLICRIHCKRICQTLRRVEIKGGRLFVFGCRHPTWFRFPESQLHEPRIKRVGFGL